MIQKNVMIPKIQTTEPIPLGPVPGAAPVDDVLLARLGLVLANRLGHGMKRRTMMSIARGTR